MIDKAEGVALKCLILWYLWPANGSLWLLDRQYLLSKAFLQFTSCIARKCCESLKITTNQVARFWIDRQNDYCNPIAHMPRVNYKFELTILQIHILHRLHCTVLTTLVLHYMDCRICTLLKTSLCRLCFSSLTKWNASKCTVALEVSVGHSKPLSRTSLVGVLRALYELEYVCIHIWVLVALADEWVWLMTMLASYLKPMRDPESMNNYIFCDFKLGNEQVLRCIWSLLYN